MTNYERLYRLGITPWERYGRATAESTRARLDREAADRGRPLGRALDLGCGRGLLTPELARCGWEAVGIDYVPGAVEAARRNSGAGVTYVVGDVTDLNSAELGTFDFFLDVGCFQGFDGEQRRAEGRGVTALADPGATVLLLAFGATRLRRMVGGVARGDVQEAFAAWDLVAVEPAETDGLGWPMNRTAPAWYRFRLRG
ncbi:class I SAM-dependent methyltransferase [Pseudonocardia nematodicida]|uniref:Class I SAM-dependent methyltransferase n=1 Tax=Pseudonocardia nematodicida TaxID=1206997 RepID=A0ABV1KDL5_9PSEU